MKMREPPSATGALAFWLLCWPTASGAGILQLILCIAAEIARNAASVMPSPVSA
jgi:hypothetical protein